MGSETRSGPASSQRQGPVGGNAGGVPLNGTHVSPFRRRSCDLWPAPLTMLFCFPGLNPRSGMIMRLWIVLRIFIMRFASITVPSGMLLMFTRSSRRSSSPAANFFCPSPDSLYIFGFPWLWGSCFSCRCFIETHFLFHACHASFGIQCIDVYMWK